MPIIEINRRKVDIRDMKGATWKDVVASVLEECDGAVSLSYLYEQIEPYKKAKENQFWREKVRQTLQINKEYFQSTQRGMWRLKTKSKEIC